MKNYLIGCALMMILTGCAGKPGPRQMEFVPVKGGCFQMGDSIGVGEADEKPVHEVCLSEFNIGKYEVTQDQWEKIMGSNPSTHRQCGPDCPVESVSWNMIQEFIEKLNKESGKQHRLPTEAEWEYAARSGGKDDIWAGTSDRARLGEFSFFNENSGDVRYPVGMKLANGLGLHDMSGSVAEWCLDRYDDAYYKKSPRSNPLGADAGDRRVVRGGGPYDSERIRTTKRHSDEPHITDSDYGFRLVRPARQ